MENLAFSQKELEISRMDSHDQSGLVKLVFFCCREEVSAVQK